MSDREPVLRDCFKVKKGLCVTGDAYITGNLTLSGDFAWLNPDALLTVGNIETINLSAGRLYSSNDELVVVPFGPDYTILHPLSVVDETVFESAVQMESDLWVKGNLRVDGNAYLSAGIDGVINVGDTNTDNVVFNADIQSSLIPNTTDTYDLGSVDQHWDTLYVHDISAHGSVDIEDSLFVSGTTTLSGALSAGSDATLSNNLTVSADTTIGGTTTLSGALSAGSDVKIDGILDVELDATLSSNLTVSANTTVGGNTTLSGTFSAAGDSKIDSDLHVVGDLRVDGDVWFNANNTNGTNTINLGDDNTDNVVFNADIDSDIIPDKTLTNTLGISSQQWLELFVQDISATGDVTISDTLNVSGDTNIVGDISATGAITLTETLTVSSDTIIGGTTTLSGILSTVSDDKFDEDVHIVGDLRVDGDVWFNANNTNGTNTINLGDDNTDNVVFNADIDSDIIPDDNITFDLGSATQQWRELHTQDVSISRDLSSNRHVNFPNLSAGSLSGNFVSIQSDGELTTSTVSVDAIEQIGTVVNETSANWNSVYASVTATSAEWDSVYSYVNDNSATNNLEFNDTRFVNVTGDTMTGDLNLGTNKIITRNVTTGIDSGFLTLAGGTNQSNGAQILLFGDNNTNPNNNNRAQINADNIFIGDVFASGSFQPWMLHIDVDNEQIILGGLSPLNNSDISVYGTTTVSGDVLPNTDADYDLGSSTHQWNTIYTQDVSASGDVHVAGDLRIDGDVWFNANNTGGTNTINLGDDSTDSVVFNADIDSDIIPDKNMAYDLGSVNQHWSTLYVHDVSAHGSVSANGLTVIGDISASGDIYAANHSLIFSDGDPSNDTTWSKSDSITAKRVAGEWDGIHDDGSLTIPVSVSVAGDFVADGDVVLGQPNTTIMLGKIGSDLIPTQHDVFSLGSGNDRFLTGHFSEIDVNIGVTSHSVSTETVYFPAPVVDDLGVSPAVTSVYDEERNLTYTDILSSRDTTSIVQANSADWANHAPTERIQVLTRSALNLTFNSGNGTNDIFKEFITIATDNPVGDARWDDITYAHAMVLPYNTVVKKIILRGTATQSATVNIGVHTNNGVTDTNTIEYKYFTETPTATAENTFQINNEPKVFTFADTTSALEGSTLGISISGTKVISAVNLSIVLAYSD